MKEMEHSFRPLATVAAWYIAAIAKGNEARSFPATDRPTYRFDGKMRRTMGFRVFPFEFPIVPFPGAYTFYLFDEYGAALKNPAGWGEFDIVPLVRIAFESGSLINS